MRHLEDKEQIALITWVRLMESKHPELSTIYHCPNGGHRDIRRAGRRPSDDVDLDGVVDRIPDRDVAGR